MEEYTNNEKQDIISIMRIMTRHQADKSNIQCKEYIPKKVHRNQKYSYNFKTSKQEIKDKASKQSVKTMASMQ